MGDMLSGLPGAQVVKPTAEEAAGALAELLSVNALEAPGTNRGTAADAGVAGHEPPDEVAAAPTRVPVTVPEEAAKKLQ